MLINIHTNNYTKHFLGVTGPLLLKKFINTNIFLKHDKISDDKWKDSFIIDNYNDIIIKCSYDGYYDENNYLKTDHYSIKWNNKNIYNKISIDYNKINLIKHIVWINLDRSIERKKNMEKIFLNINIPNTRISGIDGKNEDVKKYILPLKTSITNSEIACTLSHIKSISYLHNLDNTKYLNTQNNYYLVCEDDISLNNLILFNNDLNDIISNCPDFDILLIYKTYRNKLDNLYTDWNIEFKKNANNHIAGTCSYIVSSNGIKNIMNDFYYKDKKFIINRNMDVADKFIYKDFKTFVYKYNFININEVTSTIHSDHLNWHNICSKKQINYIINDNTLKS